MIDTRFYDKQEFLTFKKVCDTIGIDLPDQSLSDKKILNIAKLDEATDSDITFFHNAKYKDMLKNTKAFACLVSKAYKSLVPTGTIALVVDEPYFAHALLLKEFYKIKSKKQSSISDKASISKNSTIEEGCTISDFVTISDGAVVKKGSYIGPHTTILEGVEIGENSHIESNVTIGFAVIGKNAYIKTGARIGQQGFGFHVGKTGITDVMQIGKVIIGDDVQVGANCTIDRGSMEDTIIGSHSRLDNMVHIAHNVELGEYTVIAAQTGIAGSVTVGKMCFFGGQVGVAGHLSIGNKVTVAAQSGIMRNVEDGSKIGGTPAVGIMQWHKQNVELANLVKGTAKLSKLQILKNMLKMKRI